MDEKKALKIARGQKHGLLQVVLSNSAFCMEFDVRFGVQLVLELRRCAACATSFSLPFAWAAILAWFFEADNAASQFEQTLSR